MIQFGQYRISAAECFYETGLSYAIVNSSPLTRGHVLVIPKRTIQRVVDLTSEEHADLMITAVRVGSKVQHHVGAYACTYAIQDGVDAGQTVRHVHMHVVPRLPNDFKHNEIYEKLGVERERHTLDEMSAEANEYRVLFVDK